MRHSPAPLALLLLCASTGCHLILPLDRGTPAGDVADLERHDVPGGLDVPGGDAPAPDRPPAEDLRKETGPSEGPSGEMASADGPLVDLPASCNAWTDWTCQTLPPTIECLADCGTLSIICYTGNGDCSCYKNHVTVSQCSGMGGTTACNRCATAFQKGCCN